MADPLPTILQLADAGTSVADIAAAVDLTPGRVYGILRTERPDRTRSPRTRTSKVPNKVRALAAKGTKPARIAFVLGCSRAYVYRILGEAAE